MVLNNDHITARPFIYEYKYFLSFLLKINNLSNPVKNAPKNVFIKTMAIFKNI